MAPIEVLLPIGYKHGDKVTDKVIEYLNKIYGTIVLTHKPSGRYYAIIILNSYTPHDDSILDVYDKFKTWYFMYDMNWGQEWYLKHKTQLQLITDKDYPGSRIVIPNGMLELSQVQVDKSHKKLNTLCIMESYKTERMDQYEKYLRQVKQPIDVIGTTMNKHYKHCCNKVDSVPYSKLPALLGRYKFCLILWDKYHDRYNLPIKVAECLQNNVVPILECGFGTTFFPTVSNIDELVNIVDTYDTSNIDTLVHYWRGKYTIRGTRRLSHLVETDTLLLRELEDLLVWGREKHQGHYWRDNLDVKDFIAALKRHLAAYERGDTIDEETGMSHLISIVANAMFQRRIDEQ